MASPSSQSQSTLNKLLDAHSISENQLSIECDETLFCDLSDEVVFTCLRSLVTRLRLTGVEFQHIEKNYDKDYKRQVIEVFRKWRNKNLKNEATYLNLIKVFIEETNMEAVECVIEFFKTHHPQSSSKCHSSWTNSQTESTQKSSSSEIVTQSQRHSHQDVDQAQKLKRNLKDREKGEAETATTEMAKLGTAKADAENGLNLEGAEVKSQALEAEAKQVEQEAKEQTSAEWDEFYMKIACLAALRSEDASTPVGACIANEDYQVVGVGFNDIVYPYEGSEKKHHYIAHAARNAVFNARDSIRGCTCTIYLTHFPDIDCVNAIIEAKITKIVYCMFTRHDKREDKDDMRAAREILEKTHIKIIRMDNLCVSLKDRMDKIKSLYKKNKKDWPSGPAQNVMPWETFFMKVALLSKERSHHPHYKVGACVVSPNKTVLAIGYNAYPVGIIHDKSEYANQDSKSMSHAECKAILSLPSVEGYTLYVTKYPCYKCAHLIVHSRISEVVYDEQGGWEDETYKSSQQILTKNLGKDNIKNIRSFNTK